MMVKDARCTPDLRQNQNYKWHTTTTRSRIWNLINGIVFFPQEIRRCGGEGDRGGGQTSKHGDGRFFTSKFLRSGKRPIEDFDI